MLSSVNGFSWFYNYFFISFWPNILCDFTYQKQLFYNIGTLNILLIVYNANSNKTEAKESHDSTLPKETWILYTVYVSSTCWNGV